MIVGILMTASKQHQIRFKMPLLPVFTGKVRRIESALIPPTPYGVGHNEPGNCSTQGAISIHPPRVNCTPFVRQYGILNNKWGVCYAKRSTK